MYICICNAVTDRDIRSCVAQGARCLEDLQIDLGVATCCGKCASMASTYLPTPGGPCLIEHAGHKDHANTTAPARE